MGGAAGRGLARMALSLLVVFCAGALAGASVVAFLVAALAVAAVRWGAAFGVTRGRCRYFILDPKASDAEGLVSAFRAVVDEATRSRRAMVLRVAVPADAVRYRLCVGLAVGGDVEVSGYPRAKALQRPGVWVADHPVPLGIPVTRSLSLAFSPCAGGRVRVAEAAPTVPHPCVWGGALLLVVFAVYFGLVFMLAAVVASVGEAYLLRLR